MPHTARQEFDCNTPLHLRALLLAFFAPIYSSRNCLILKTEMVSTYAVLYIKRSAVTAALALLAGELLYLSDYILLGTVMTGVFVLFSGLFGVYLIAILEKKAVKRSE